MKLNILAVGAKPPAWVAAGVEEYCKRMPRELNMQVQAIAAPRHHKDPVRFKQLEGARMLELIGRNDWVVALDERGQQRTSLQLSDRLAHWQMQGRDVCLLVGGSDGLDAAVLARADEQLSLSQLTLPHYLARLVLVETLYRAWSIGTGHPYHRE